jgi:peroxin-16
MAPRNVCHPPEPTHESFIVSYPHVIGTIESSIRSLSWFLPWFRFQEADLASESLTALLNLTSLYHDVLVGRRLRERRPRSLSQVFQTDHSRSRIHLIWGRVSLCANTAKCRYTAAWCASDLTYKYAARSLEIVKHLQLVIEMLLSRRNNPRIVWRGIVIIEMLK